MRRLTSVLAAASLTVALAACGGDDDGAEAPDTPDAPSATDEPADDPGEVPTPDADEPAPEAPPEPDGPTPGAPGDIDLDMLEEMFGDLDGIDLQMLEEMLGDFDLENFDPENFDPDMFEDLFDGMDDFISGFGSDGSGRVIVDGVTFEFTSDSCVSFGDDFFIDGPAVGSDGSEAWVSISRDLTTRADMEEFMDESMLDTMFPEGQDVLEGMFLDVQVGATSRFDWNDDQPNWTTSAGEFAFGDAVVDFEFSGDAIRGSGRAEDSNFVETDFGETVPIEFEAACN